MPISSAVTHVDHSRRRKTITATLTPSGNYPAGGDTVDLTKLTNARLLSNAFPGSVPTKVEIINAPAGYSGEWIPGTTLANGKLKISTAPVTELAAGAYPAALIADPFQVEISGPTGKF